MENKAQWSKPGIKSELPISETLGAKASGNADTNNGGNNPRS
ncbi:hypothetical protein ACNI3T_09070 [Christiangramia sp. ASW11-125]